MGKGRPRQGTPLTPAEQAQRKQASKKSPWRGNGKMIDNKQLREFLTGGKTKPI